MPQGAAYEAFSAPRSSRLIFIGDIHGCIDELRELLERVGPAGDDVVVSVGDMVNKGPAPAKCLDLWRQRGYRAVQGNNEVKLLEQARRFRRFFARQNRDVLRRKDLLDYIASWPRVLDFPRQGVTAVHGGFLPDMEVTPESVALHRDLVHHLRWIRRTSDGWSSVPKKEKKKDDVLWAEKWNGDRFVVYGHTPLQTPRFDARALGLDTGCVYGRTLTAAIRDGDRWETVSVPARRAYAG